ncbi:head completion/stabilization protein, partial [Escherichia coli]
MTVYTAHPPPDFFSGVNSMSMVARTEPGPAEDDITDTDDGDTRISA